MRRDESRVSVCCRSRGIRRVVSNWALAIRVLVSLVPERQQYARVLRGTTAVPRSCAPPLPVRQGA